MQNTMRRMFLTLTYFTALCVLSLYPTHGDMMSGRIRGDDEPHIVSWRVLEGVTEPFDSYRPIDIPVWRQMKNSADLKAANMMIQHALHEYGQLLRHWHFGDMPHEERYDVFLSMSKLLKMMGFHQRAELLLYEAMSYSTVPYEAHLQLGLLFLDKEDLERAKVHFKNCLFFRENDILILSHLSVVLIAEWKIHEAKFFISRILTRLEGRVRKLTSFLNMNQQDLTVMTAPVEYPVLARWAEDLFSKVFHGDFRVTPSGTMDLFRMFSNLYTWLSAGEMSGRFLFDLGQSLYEGGRPRVGRMMMQKGFETSDPVAEGIVSTEIVTLRLALDYPVVPGSMLEIVAAYLNVTSHLSSSSRSYETVALENVMDVYWPLPLVWWSALPMGPVLSEVMWRFEPGPLRRDTPSQIWLNSTHNEWRERGDEEQILRESLKGLNGMKGMKGEEGDQIPDSVQHPSPAPAAEEPSFLSGLSALTSLWTGDEKKTKPDKPKEIEEELEDDKLIIEVGVFGGHMNNHAVGQMVLHRILGIHQAMAGAKNAQGEDIYRVTLIALALVPDATTAHIASKVHRIVNLPMDTGGAWVILEQLHLDIVLFPDWQPFPDQQAALFMNTRIAPVQACFFVRGSSCVSLAVDYYLMPSELEQSYYSATPACDSLSVIRGPSNNGSRSVTPMRPMWLEAYNEQVVLLDWPVLTPQTVQNIAKGVVEDSRKEKIRGGKGREGGKGAAGGAGGRRKAAGNAGRVKSEASPPSLHATLPFSDMTSAEGFTPSEVEGQVFFEGQPVAIIPVHPTYLHPLMDDVLFKIMHAQPLLQVVLVLSDSFFSHLTDSRHKMNWARRVVRRLWARGGNLYQRIRLLPAPLSDQRLLQLLRQADFVLDSFPIGGSFHTQSLALSVGTPVVTMRTGTRLATPRENLREIRTHLQQLLQAQKLAQSAQTNTTSKGGKRRIESNPMYRRLVPPIAITPDPNVGMSMKNNSSGSIGGSLGSSGGGDNNSNKGNKSDKGNSGDDKAEKVPVVDVMTDREAREKERARIAEMDKEREKNRSSQSGRERERGLDIPWNPSISSVCGFYDRVGLGHVLVANSTADYFRLANNLVSDREAAYFLRVKLLEAVDKKNPLGGNNRQGTFPSTPVGSGGGSGGGTGEGKGEVKVGGLKGENNGKVRESSPVREGISEGQGGVTDGQCEGDCLEDLAKFIESVGRPWAERRVRERRRCKREQGKRAR